ncbi:translocation/assembly module TamB domain-containing protein, partial [bacterium]|nr:translocation/assembly module TamB domain-containing protein [bacterium]
NFTLLADGRSAKISNVPYVDIENNEREELRLEPMVLREDGLTWGVLILESEKNGLKLNLPELMEREELCVINIGGRNSNEKFYFAGPTDNPVVRGRIDVEKMDFTYPFLRGEGSKKGKVERFLERIYWDLIVYSTGDVKYFRVEPSSFSTITDNIYLNIAVEAVNGIEFRGVIDENTFTTIGNVVSTRGTIEFLDLLFKVERFDVTFDERNTYPQITGRARTTIRDSTFARDVYIVPYYQIENDKEEIHSFENLKFTFEMYGTSDENPSLEISQEEILRMLGYSVSDIGTKAPTVFGVRAQNVLLRPLVRPIERKARDLLGLDELTFRPSFAKNLTQYFFEESLNINPSKRLGEKMFVRPTLLFQSSSLVVGKYIGNDFYFTYEGQLVTGFDKDAQENLGLNHLLGIEYRIAPGIMLDMQYDYQYDRYVNKEDKRLWIRHYFRLSD